MSTVEADTREEVLDELRDATRFVLVTHENPDGDALGSLVAMHRILLALGKDSVMYMAADEFPLPYEYRFFELDGLQSTLPDDLDERTIVFLDCGNIDRNPVGAFKREEAHILNIDHHHDNTRFGTVNHVVEDASCTAEIVWDLMRALGVEPALEIAEALYVGLVTDTGKFMYENTGVRAHEMAADLIEAGVDVHGIYRRLYEGMPYAKLELLARALAHVQRYDEGRLAKDLGAAVTPRIADALYTGLVTDTGKFMYENTTPEAHRMAADLIEAGVEPHEVYRRLYEDLPFRRLQLLQRALASVDRYDGGVITIAHLLKDDYEQTGAQETDSEGVVDHMRAVEGTAVAVLVRELLSDDRDGMRKVSLRATDGRVDVSRIAREFGGGGHPQAAGFATPLPYPQLVEKLGGLVRGQLESR